MVVTFVYIFTLTAETTFIRIILTQMVSKLSRPLNIKVLIFALRELEYFF